MLSFIAIQKSLTILDWKSNSNGTGWFICWYSVNSQQSSSPHIVTILDDDPETSMGVDMPLPVPASSAAVKHVSTSSQPLQREHSTRKTQMKDWNLMLNEQQFLLVYIRSSHPEQSVGVYRILPCSTGDHQPFCVDVMPTLCLVTYKNTSFLNATAHWNLGYLPHMKHL